MKRNQRQRELEIEASRAASRQITKLEGAEEGSKVGSGDEGDAGEGAEIQDAINA